MAPDPHVCAWDFRPAALAQISKGLTGWIPCAEAACPRTVFFKKDWVPAKACEYVATRLARAIGLPAPEIWLVEPAPGYRGTYAERLPVETDWADVTRFAPDPAWCLPLAERFVNPEALFGMVVFDLWIGNADRSATNVPLRTVATDRHEVFLIDHGEAADGGAWLYRPNPDDPYFIATGRPPRFGKQLAPALEAIRACPDHLAPWIDAVRAVSDATIAGLIAEVPPLYFDEYDDDPGREERLERLLIGRRDRIVDLVAHWLDTPVAGA